VSIELRPYQQDLLDKTTNAFKKGFRKVLVESPCGSGKTILLTKMASMAQDNGKTVWFILPRQEIMEQTFETFERCGVPLNTVHIGMIITMANHLKELPEPDLIIYDECHISVSNTYNKISNAFPNAFIVGATASPCRTDNRPLGDLYETIVRGVTVRWLIDNHYLAPYDYYSVLLTDLASAETNGDYDTVKASELLMTSAIYGDIIKSWYKFADGMQTVVYCCSIAHSQKTTEMFNNAGITAVHFDGNTSKAERKRIVDDFRDGKFKVLVNCDLISMGFDMPDINCVMLLRPTQSASLFIQQSGRALRYKPNKRAVIIDMVGNYNRFQLPDEPYDWSLTQSVKKRKEFNDDGTLSIRQCSECFRCFKTANKCPYCGYEYEVKGRELKAVKEVELKKIEAIEKAEQEKQKKLARMEVGQCRTIADLQKIAKERNYKQAWVWQMARIKHITR
jgi:superfamily II DNA or RNA helicase